MQIYGKRAYRLPELFTCPPFRALAGVDRETMNPKKMTDMQIQTEINGTSQKLQSELFSAQLHLSELSLLAEEKTQRIKSIRAVEPDDLGKLLYGKVVGGNWENNDQATRNLFIQAAMAVRQA